MLLELVVENYAVVERLRVPFHPGLNVMTGETGSGKSIVVDALGLLLGGRASIDFPLPVSPVITFKPGWTGTRRRSTTA